MNSALKDLTHRFNTTGPNSMWFNTNEDSIYVDYKLTFEGWYGMVIFLELDEIVTFLGLIGILTF